MAIKFYKHHRLLVKGRRVSAQQAAVVLLQTLPFRGLRRPRWSNLEEPEWEDAICAILGLGDKGNCDEVEDEVQRLGSLNLRHLTNNPFPETGLRGLKMNSAWIDWNGTFCGMGQRLLAAYPTEEEIRDELTRLAASYPFLDATFQVLQSEDRTYRGEPIPLASWRVRGGKVGPTQEHEACSPNIKRALLYPEQVIQAAQRVLYDLPAVEFPHRSQLLMAVRSLEEHLRTRR